MVRISFRFDDDVATEVSVIADVSGCGSSLYEFYNFNGFLYSEALSM